MASRCLGLYQPTVPAGAGFASLENVICHPGIVKLGLFQFRSDRKYFSATRRKESLIDIGVSGTGAIFHIPLIENEMLRYFGRYYNNHSEGESNV